MKNEIQFDIEAAIKASHEGKDLTARMACSLGWSSHSLSLVQH